jgi:hypothetical protein
MGEYKNVQGRLRLHVEIMWCPACWTREFGWSRTTELGQIAPSDRLHTLARGTLAAPSAPAQFWPPPLPLPRSFLPSCTRWARYSQRVHRLLAERRRSLSAEAVKELIEQDEGDRRAVDRREPEVNPAAQRE